MDHFWLSTVYISVCRQNWFRWCYSADLYRRLNRDQFHGKKTLYPCLMFCVNSTVDSTVWLLCKLLYSVNSISIVYESVTQSVSLLVVQGHRDHLRFKHYNLRSRITLSFYLSFSLCFPCLHKVHLEHVFDTKAICLPITQLASKKDRKSVV